MGLEVDQRTARPLLDGITERLFPSVFETSSMKQRSRPQRWRPRAHLLTTALSYPYLERATAGLRAELRRRGVWFGYWASLIAHEPGDDSAPIAGTQPSGQGATLLLT